MPDQSQATPPRSLAEMVEAGDIYLHQSMAGNQPQGEPVLRVRAASAQELEQKGVEVYRTGLHRDPSIDSETFRKAAGGPAAADALLSQVQTAKEGTLEWIGRAVREGLTPNPDRGRNSGGGGRGMGGGR